MKIRNGFVSNSSSSSFIVRHYNSFDNTKDKKGILDGKAIKKLLKYGFKETYLAHPSVLENISCFDKKVWKPEISKDGTIISKNYGFQVDINPKDTMKWLIENNIGFIASVHYNHYTYLFHKNDKFIMCFRNYGIETETYSYDKTWEEIIKEQKLTHECEPYYKIPVKNFLEV